MIQVKGHDGKAGMATLLARNSTLDLDTLAQHLSSALPPCAVPLFIRISTKLELTGLIKFNFFFFSESTFYLIHLSHLHVATVTPIFLLSATLNLINLNPVTACTLYHRPFLPAGCAAITVMN